MDNLTWSNGRICISGYIWMAHISNKRSMKRYGKKSILNLKISTIRYDIVRIMEGSPGHNEPSPLPSGTATSLFEIQRT
jgi:hypothetical protein